jgi:hypothetical protein
MVDKFVELIRSCLLGKFEYIELTITGQEKCGAMFGDSANHPPGFPAGL